MGILAVSPSIPIGQIPGSADGSNGAAGTIGEYFLQDVVSGSFVPVTNAGTVYNVTSKILTAGDWDVSGSITALSAGNCTQLFAGISLASTTLPTVEFTTLWGSAAGAGTGNGMSFPVPMVRVTSSGPVTVYLCGRMTNTDVSGTSGLYGTLMFRRVR